MPACLLVAGPARRAELKQALAGAGLEVVAAPGLFQGQELLLDREVDLVVADAACPDFGPALLQTLLAEAAPAEAMVLLSAKIRPADLAGLGLDAGRLVGQTAPAERVAALALSLLDLSRHQRTRNYLLHTQDLIHRPEQMVARSPASRAVLALASKLARSDQSVLITGETGTGKGLLAGLIHFNSLRRQANFVEVNVAALPETLLESELFGHVRGAFTGAVKDRVGRFEQADGGSILLDEIGDLPPPLQVKVLRVLETKSFERVGSSRTRRVDVRIMAATNKDLEAEIRGGRFREDLYFRLQVLTIHLPPLRERVEDIPPLAEFFLKRSGRETNRPSLTLSPAAVQVLRAHPWPGNVRELKNAMERAALLTSGTEVEPLDLGLGPTRFPTPGPDHRAARRRALAGLTLAQAEELLIRTALEETGWVQKEAARLLGLSRRALNYKVAKLGLTHPSWTVNKPRGEV